jgi:hypothetical protein
MYAHVAYSTTEFEYSGSAASGVATHTWQETKAGQTGAAAGDGAKENSKDLMQSAMVAITQRDGNQYCITTMLC